MSTLCFISVYNDNLIFNNWQILLQSWIVQNCVALKCNAFRETLNDFNITPPFDGLNYHKYMQNKINSAIRSNSNRLLISIDSEPCVHFSKQTGPFISMFCVLTDWGNDWAHTHEHSMIGGESCVVDLEHSYDEWLNWMSTCKVKTKCNMKFRYFESVVFKRFTIK